MSEPVVRVLVCDDSFGFSALVANALRADGRFEHVGTARSGGELLELLETVDADAVVLDLVLPDVDNPATLVAEIRRRADVRILLVSSLKSSELARAAAGAGVDGFQHKATAPKDLGDALYAVATG